MIRTGIIVLGIVATGVLAGCNLPSPGTTRVLGNVQSAEAFATAKEVMSQYFSIASADPDTGLIESRPKPVAAQPERLLGSSPARQLAKLHIGRKNGLIIAHLSVALQREGSSIHRTMQPPGENYDSVPNLTPAEDTAATTPEQNEAWRTDRYDRALERRILNDLYKALHPAEE